MSLSKRDINPLNVFGMRRINHIPPHFSCLIIDSHWDERIKKIDQWVYINLNSRYCIKTTQFLDDKRKIYIKCVLGIEDPKELTWLTLKCPYINNNK